MTPLAAGTVIAGRHRLERRLARGGMGSVWVARQLSLDTDVAIKFMAPEYASSAEARARFEREAKACAQIRSPHVVQVHDYGVDGDLPYIVMELLEGEDLDKRLRRAGRLSIQDTQRIVDQVCKALRRAHEFGLVHRDLKPGNLFLSNQAGDEIVKVLDFGIAKAIGPVLADNATRTGTLIGSPHYMSPEQVRRSKLVDHRSDLWSLGVILFQCLTGRLPFSGEELGDLLVEVCTDPIPPPSRFVPELPEAVDRFFERALTRDPAQRFQSARELADAFAALVEGPQASRSGVWSQVTPPPGPALIVAAALATPAPVEASSPALPAPILGGKPPPSLPSLSNETLAPSGGTFASPPKRRVGLVIGLAAVAGVALGALVFALRTPAPAAAAAPVTTAALPLGSPPAASASPSTSPAAPPEPAPASSPEAAATPAKATAPNARSPLPQKHAAPKSTDKKRVADPLDSR